MIQTRIAYPEDINMVSAVLAASWKTAYRGIVNDDYLNSIQDNHWVAFLITGIGNGTIFSMILESNKNIIGAAIIGKGETDIEANLISFYLLPDKIGRGYGHTFYSGIEKELKNRGFSKCVLDVLEHNARANRFYNSHGFVDINKRITADLGGYTYTCKVFEKRI